MLPKKENWAWEVVCVCVRACVRMSVCVYECVWYLLKFIKLSRVYLWTSDSDIKALTPKHYNVLSSLGNIRNVIFPSLLISSEKKNYKAEVYTEANYNILEAFAHFHPFTNKTLIPNRSPSIYEGGCFLLALLWSLLSLKETNSWKPPSLL